MDISQQKSGDLLVIRLAGRLDANWCHPVQNALTAAVRDGEHRVQLDMADVSYVSSSGLRVLLSFYKQLRAIHGSFSVANPSAAVRSILELSGLAMLIMGAAETGAGGAAAGPEEKGRAHASASASYEIFSTGAPASGVRLACVGDIAVLARGAAGTPAVRRRFGENAFALGVGALGAGYADCEARFGEFLAVAGAAAFQPADGSSQPDFMASQGTLVPEGHLLLGFTGEGTFPLLARFEAGREARAVGLTELAQTALDLSGSSAAAVVALTETSGLVGATLQKSPAFAEASAGGPAAAGNAGGTAAAGNAESALGPRFGFPRIRDWLSFTSERVFRDSTSLVVGVVARPGTALDPLLRPLRPPGFPPAAPDSRPSPPGSGLLLGHFHAAVFPYCPLRKGRLELKPAVATLFNDHALQAVLHLLADPREFNGAGESAFFRGALWIAPVSAD